MDLEFSRQGGGCVGGGRVNRDVAHPVPGKVAAIGISHQQAVIRRARFLDDQSRSICIAHQIVEIDAAGPQQFANQGKDKKAVGCRPDADPLVGNGAVAGAAWIDGNHLDAARFELAEADLDRVGIVIFGNAEQHEVPGMIPVRLAEFPERTADRVETSGRHVHRTKAAMGGVIGGTKLRRPPTCE
jgi:hypothetical protein